MPLFKCVFQRQVFEGLSDFIPFRSEMSGFFNWKDSSAWRNKWRSSLWVLSFRQETIDSSYAAHYQRSVQHDGWVGSRPFCSSHSQVYRKLNPEGSLWSLQAFIHLATAVNEASCRAPWGSLWEALFSQSLLTSVSKRNDSSTSCRRVGALSVLSLTGFFFLRETSWWGENS